MGIFIFACQFNYSAQAAEIGCPKDQIGPTPLKPVTEPIGQIEVQTHSLVDLGKQAIGAPGWNFRARSIFFGSESSGPVHSHDRSPEFVMVKHGSITLHDANCKVPITLIEGQVYHAGIGTTHWGVNPTKDPVIVYIVDIVDEKELAK
jgi:quercetin dioxygenase-like cupin family protein